MDKNKACLRGRWVETMLEGADETEVGIFEASSGVNKTVVEQGIAAGIFHERLELAPGKRR
jgi:hypothetical protein